MHGPGAHKAQWASRAGKLCAGLALARGLLELIQVLVENRHIPRQRLGGAWAPRGLREELLPVHSG